MSLDTHLLPWVIFGAIFTFITLIVGGLRLLSEMDTKARAERQRTKDALGTILIGEIECLNPDIIHVSKKAVLVLTSSKLMVFNKHPFKNTFVIPLDHLTKIECETEFPSKIESIIKITFLTANNNEIVVQFIWPVNFTAREWVSKISAVQRGDIKGEEVQTCCVCGKEHRVERLKQCFNCGRWFCSYYDQIYPNGQSPRDH